jgi:hypothetical protein
MAYFNGTTLISKDLAEIYEVKIASQESSYIWLALCLLYRRPQFSPKRPHLE